MQDSHEREGLPKLWLDGVQQRVVWPHNRDQPREVSGGEDAGHLEAWEIRPEGKLEGSLASQGVQTLGFVEGEVGKADRRALQGQGRERAELRFGTWEGEVRDYRGGQ